MSASPDIGDFRKPDVALDEQFNAASAALDAYIEAAPRAKMSVWDFLKHAYDRTLATARAQELQWLDALVVRLGGVYEKRRQHGHGRVVCKALSAVHELRKSLFRRYSRVAFRLYSRALVYAHRLEVANALLKFKDLFVLCRVLAKIDEKFDSINDALKSRCDLCGCHAADYTTETDANPLADEGKK